MKNQTNEIAQFWGTCVESAFQLLSGLNIFPTGALIQEGALINAVHFYRQVLLLGS